VDIVHGYTEDLAAIHDAGFSGCCLSAVPGLLGILRRYGIGSGMIFDLGCGRGRWARELTRRVYKVLGVDQSPAFLRLAAGTHRARDSCEARCGARPCQNARQSSVSASVLTTASGQLEASRGSFRASMPLCGPAESSCSTLPHPIGFPWPWLRLAATGGGTRPLDRDLSKGG
jgi:hypothetical protein